MIILQVFVFYKTYHLVLTDSALLHHESASSVRPSMHVFKVYSFARCFPTMSFSENMILFLRRKMKDDLSQKRHGNMIFSVYSVKMVFFFLQICYYLSVRNPKIIFSRKSTLRDDISRIIEKDDIYPRKYGISSDRKNKDDKKVFFYKKVPMILCTFMETFKGVFIYCFPMKKKQKT